MAGSKDGAHRWRFYRAGGVDQVRLETGADLVHLDTLDQHLWVALSCPVKGLELDERTLTLIDTDGDGRVRAPEIVAVSRWLRAALKDPETLVRGEGAVALANLDVASPEGRRLHDAARHLLAAQGKAEATSIAVADTTKAVEICTMAKRNGDGVVPPDAVEDEGGRRLATDVVDCLGGLPDRGGRPGVDAAMLARFLAECDAYAAWWKAPEADKKAVLVLGDATAAAAAAYEAVRAKVDDWFARSRLAAFDARALAAVNRREEEYLAVAAGDLSIDAREAAGLPLARVEPDQPLPLTAGLNPAWADTVAAFRAAAAPLLNGDATSMTEADWRKVGTTLAPWRAWAAAKAGGVVEKLGIARIHAIVSGTGRAALEKAIADDLAVAPHVAAIAEVEKLVRCHRDFFTLANNFVAFTDFYARRKATFQAGMLHLDGRTCDLCLQVNDPGKHATLGAMAGIHLVYLDCTRPGGLKMPLVAAVTAGSVENLFVGRNGLFYDRQGRDWDATITRIVDNPISVKEAFWSPYRKVLRWAEEMLAKRAAAADAAATEKLKAAAEVAPAGAKPVAAAPVKPRIDVGTVAALGVAVGGITAALGALLGALFGLKMWMPLGILGLLLFISGPAMLIAWRKLRRRNLGPLLDANGWAVNALTKVNVPLGRSLTTLAELPPDAERTLRDPFAPKRRTWPWVLLLLLAFSALGFVLWKRGYLVDWLPPFPF